MEKNKPVVIGTSENRSTLVITDGFHYSHTLEIHHQHRETYFLTVGCSIDDDRLLAGAILTLLFFLTGLTSGIVFIRLLSFLPTLYFVYTYYFNRRNFIKIKAGV
ncbi:MAG: hypothetical protein WKF70_03425 [Chitinophagaceae bacterium]